MTDPVIYGTPVSPFVRKVEAVLRTQGVAYDFENINIMDMPDWFCEISPARRIPVLRDRSAGREGVSGTIADSSAICLYLDRKLDAGLDGETAFDAGRVAALEEFADSELAQLDLVVSSAYADCWPALAEHTEAMKAHVGFVDNLASCQKMLGKLVPKRVELS